MDLKVKPPLRAGLMLNMYIYYQSFLWLCKVMAIYDRIKVKIYIRSTTDINLT